MLNIVEIVLLKLKISFKFKKKFLSNIYIGYLLEFSVNPYVD